MTMVITWTHLWSSFADHCSGHCGVRVKARHQVLSVGSAENGEEDEEKDRSRNGMCLCSYLRFILNLLPRKALTLTNIVPNEITKGGLGCMSSLYNRTCGWVCLESLIFPCLVFVLVLGGGAFPPFSIPSWSGRFSLLFLRRHQKTSHHIRCPDFPLFFYIVWYYFDTIYMILQFMLNLSYPLFLQIWSLYFISVIQQNLPFVHHPGPSPFNFGGSANTKIVKHGRHYIIIRIITIIIYHTDMISLSLFLFLSFSAFQSESLFTSWD